MIWFDVSATMSWARPPSGIVRSQIEICRQLLDSPDAISLCAYRSGLFVPITRTSFEAHVREIETSGEDAPSGANAPPAAALHRLYAWAIRHAPGLGRSATRFLVRMLIRWHIPVDAAGWARARSEGLLASAVCRMAPGDTYVSVSMEWLPEEKIGRIAVLKRRGVRTVLCCDDLIPFLFPHLAHRQSAKLYPTFLRRMVASSDAIMCISENTRNDLRKYTRKVGASVPLLATMCLGADTHHAVGTSISHKDLVEGEFILYVSTLERRKNHDTLYKAYVTIRTKLGTRPPRCVLVGAVGWGVKDVLTDIALDPRIKDDFLILNRVGDSELRWLYEHCLFTVFPSLYEGWGLPVAESLSYGKLVLASNRASIPEAGGALAEYLDPWDVAGWAERIVQFSQDRELLSQREAAIRAAYNPATWRDCTNALRQVIADPGDPCSHERSVISGARA